LAVSPIGSLKPAASVTVTESKDTKPVGSFKDMVKDAAGQVNRLQNQADDLALKLATGDVEDVHQAMVAMQKAKLALELTIQVRNKVVEAYQEVMRMQV